MNRLVYYYTAPNGTEYKMYSYEQVVALVNDKGGHYQAVCEPVIEKPSLYAKIKKVRAVAKR